MKIVMDRLDTYKLRNVTLAVEIDDNVITIVATQRRKYGTYEIFHQDQFATPEREDEPVNSPLHDLLEQHRKEVGEDCIYKMLQNLDTKEYK